MAMAARLSRTADSLPITLLNLLRTPADVN